MGVPSSAMVPPIMTMKDVEQLLADGREHIEAAPLTDLHETIQAMDIGPVETNLKSAREALQILKEGAARMIDLSRQAANTATDAADCFLQVARETEVTAFSTVAATRTFKNDCIEGIRMTDDLDVELERLVDLLHQAALCVSGIKRRQADVLHATWELDQTKASLLAHLDGNELD
jgi:hypothetical protein